jgi:U3 small nucleolar RNA-associated protein 25
VRLYSDFLQSDVIVASPLGLTTLLTEAAGSGDAGGADFLTSIEVAVVARADVLLMQNWMHVMEGTLDSLDRLTNLSLQDCCAVFAR